MVHRTVSFRLPQDLIEAITARSKAMNQSKTVVVEAALRQAMALPPSSDYRPSQTGQINGNGHPCLADNDAEFDSLVTLLSQASASVVFRSPSAKTASLTRQTRQQQHKLKKQMTMLLARKEKLRKQAQALKREQSELEKRRHELVERMGVLRKQVSHSTQQIQDNKKQSGGVLQNGYD